MFSHDVTAAILVFETKEKEVMLGSPNAVKVKGGMSLRNGMWHGLRNDIIVKYGKWHKERN